ncbi:hypothetical protein [Ekhidna sp.]|uniref:hypothetical protein n=1 Tax=Ekhidna sp. TaxID=2608089 RepID=UPI003BAAF40C
MIERDKKRKFYLWLLILSTAFAFVILIDVIFPSYESKEIIVDKTGYNQIVGGRSTIRSNKKYQITTAHGSFPCTRAIIYAAEVGDTIVVSRTRLLGEINYVLANNLQYENDYRAYKHLIFPVSLWVSCFFGWFLIKREKSFSTYETLIIASVMVSLFMIYTIIVN